MILSEALILLVLQLQTQQMMTSLIRSHIVYLLQTHHFVLEIYENSSLNVWFHYDFITIRDSGLLFGPPCIPVGYTAHVAESISGVCCLFAQLLPIALHASLIRPMPYTVQIYIDMLTPILIINVNCL